MKNITTKFNFNNHKLHFVAGNLNESDFLTNKVSYYSTEKVELLSQRAALINSTRPSKTDENIVFFLDNLNNINSVVIKPRISTSKIKIYERK